MNDLKITELWIEFWKKKSGLYGRKGFDELVEGKHDLDVIIEFVKFVEK